MCTRRRKAVITKFSLPIPLAQSPRLLIHADLTQDRAGGASSRRRAAAGTGVFAEFPPMAGRMQQWGRMLLLAAGLCAGLTGCFGVTQNPSYFPYLLPTGDII